MTAMALRRAMRGSRRRVAVALLLLSIGGAVAVHHAAPSQMSSMGGHGICLAVLAVAVAVVAAAAAAVKRLCTGAPVRALPRLVAVTLAALAPGSAPARAGPLYLRLRVLRI